MLQPVDPPLNPCFYYLSVRGLDRLLTPARFFILGKPVVTNLWCGTAGLIRFCYTFCTSLGPGAATTNPTDLVCLVYNNGYPPKPALLPSDIDTIPLVSRPTDPEVTDSFFCGILTSDTNAVRCIEPCSPPEPIETNPAPGFCYCQIFASLSETITSKLYGLLEVFDRQTDDRRFCTFPSFSAEGFPCSDNRLWCRPDNRGVYSLPPGELSCLMYLNGPAGAVGLISATALSGIISLSTTVGGAALATGGAGVVGLGGAGVVGLGGVAPCPAPIFCRVGTSCCMVITGGNGLRCPLRC